MKKIFTLLVSILASMILFADITVYTPTVKTPADGASYMPPNVLLDWDPVAGDLTLHYDIEISLDEGFVNPILLTTTHSSINATELMFDTEYFWRVRAADNSGVSAWSLARSFTTVDVVELYRPKKNDDEQFPNVMLIWDNKNKVTGITFWEVLVDITEDFNTPQLKHFLIPFINDTNQVQMNNLYFSQEYFWKVRAIHSKDTTEWSETWKFETLVSLELKRPKDEAVDQMPDAELIWDEVDGAHTYLYQLDKDPDFVLAKTYETVNDRANATELRFGTTYYWRVLAYHDLDSTEWSEVFSFTTIDEVVLSKPEDGTGGIDIFPTFEWESISGITSYCLWIDDNPDFDNNPVHKNVDPVSTNKVTYKLPGPALDSGTVYYWRVCALHEYDTTSMGQTWSFTILATGIESIPFNEDLIQIYPNPGNGQFMVSMKEETGSLVDVSVMDLVGQTVFSQRWDIQAGLNLKKIDIHSLPKGIYFLKMQRDNSIYSKKLVIN
jgi:hypothetical protein